MIATLAAIVGGVGLFLLGMILMTDGLKALAGDALRRWLGRFTRSRRSAVLAGAGLTALVQSSSATTLATIGFVSAGLLSFTHAIGVIIGANIGTTSTGWIVALLGLKFSVGTMALPLIGVGALMRLLGKPRVANAGMALAGFAVIFIGIDVLQTAMAGLAEHIDLTRFTGQGVGARLLLLLIGAVMTVLMQSSSAAVATTLAALSAGTISLDQAAALVVGQNIGTTVTAILASLGGTVAARRTALIHVVFNVGTGAIAFLLLPLFTWTVAGLAETAAGADHALTIAAFHTAFNLLGAAIFLPLTPQLAQLAERWLPEREVRSLRYLDSSLHTVPALAIGAAETASRVMLVDIMRALAMRLTSAPVPLDASAKVVGRLHQFLLEIPPPPGQDERSRLLELVHLVDHLDQLESLLTAPLSPALNELPALSALATELRSGLFNTATILDTGESGKEQVKAAGLEALAERFVHGKGPARSAIILASARPDVPLQASLAQLAAHRWLERTTHHAARALSYLAVAAPKS